jgi:broad specificity phosphatase PhoE
VGRRIGLEILTSEFQNLTMQSLIIIRHAPTGANDSGVFMGHLDAPNSESGLDAARILAKSPLIADGLRLFTSPLERSKATLDLITPGQPKIVDLRLIERGLGSWEGCKKSDVVRQFPHAFGLDNSLDPLFTPPDGEPVETFVSRICDFLVDISNSGTNSDALCVTHNGVIAVMRSLIEKRSLRQCFTEIEPFLRPRHYIYEPNQLPGFLPTMLEELMAGR